MVGSPVSHARFLRAMVAVGYADPDQPFAAAELPDPHLDWADEIRAALAWTRRAADGRTDEAVALVVELPAVWVALERGQIDWPKAAVFLRHLVGLSAGQSAQLCALVLPRARRWTTSEISRRLRRLILEIDPAHYERLFRRAHARRGMTACVTEDGTATLTAHGVAPEDADAAVARVDRLAHQVRRAGHPGRLDQIRVDLFVGFLDGRLHTLTDAQIITALLHDAAAGASGRGADGAQQAGAAAPPTTSPSASGSASETSEESGVGSPQAAEPESSTAERATASRSVARSTAGRAETEPAETDTPAHPRRGVQVQIALSTLLGHDERPATLPTLGPLPASRARRLVAAQHRAPWRYALTGPDGRLIRAGALRTRPHPDDLGPPAAATDPAAPGLVDLLVDAELLTRLAAPGSDLPDSWRAVLAEIRAARGRALDDAPTARFPHTGLRRHVELRDRHCTFTGCLAPAHTADLDHTRDHAHGGPTTAEDLGPICRHDHGLKHRGWT
ncbi:HNH endonuclease, partial [Pseudonocardia sp. RS11V-5]|nr:HNH endonuclease [Pseudonocardia terrae]